MTVARLLTVSAFVVWTALITCSVGAAPVREQPRSSTPGEAAPAGRSVIYPAIDAVLRFDHVIHRDTPCQRCHPSAEGSKSANDRLLPREARCRSCHANVTRRDDRVPAPGEALPRADVSRCATCHRGYKGEGVPPRILLPAARLRFSHAMHTGALVGCKTCHRFEGPHAQPLPSMRQCLACHRQRGVADRCATCHLTGKDGRLVVRFGDQRLLPSGSLHGDTHGPAFAIHHASVARSNRAYCESCHTPQQCLSCHAGTMRPMSIHPNDYVTNHVLDARRNQPRCSACHRSQTFCLSCHQRSGVAVDSIRGGFRPNTGLAFHPPGFNAPTRGPGHHAFAARRNIAACTSCHEERTCMTCHASGVRGGGGISPHGPGFGSSARCRALRARNVRVCLKCHAADPEALECR